MSEKPLGMNRRNLDLVYKDYKPGKFRVLDDKLLCKEALERIGLPTPPTLLVIDQASQLQSLQEALDEFDEFVLKPARGSGGRGILVLERQGEHWITPGGRRLGIADLQAHGHDILDGLFSLGEEPDRILIESRLHAHPLIEALYADGLSDLRIVVQDGEVLQAMLRVPTARSDGKANLHGGGVGLGINLAAGITTHASQGGRALERHPDSQAPLLGLELPDWERCCEIARKAGEATGLSYYGVDLVFDAERGPVVLELNARPGLQIQVANRAGQAARLPGRAPLADRLTTVTAWSLLALLTLGPLAFGWWQSGRPESAQAIVLKSGNTVGTRQWTPSALDEEELPVSAADPLFAAAREAEDAGDFQAAIANYRAAAENSAVEPFALNNLALLFRSQGQLQEARRELESLLERHPDYQRGHYNLGLVLRDLGQAAAAEQRMVRSLELRPSHARSWAQLGRLRADRGEGEAAEEALRQAVRYEPASRSHRVDLATLLLERNQAEEALALAREALRLQPGYSPAELIEARAQIHLHTADAPLTKIASTLESAIEADSTDSAIRQDLAITYWRQGKMAEAIPHLDRLRFAGVRRRANARLALWSAFELGLEEETRRRADELRANDASFVSSLPDSSASTDSARLSALLATRAARNTDPLGMVEGVLELPASWALWNGGAKELLRAQLPDFLPLLLHDLRAHLEGNEIREASERLQAIPPLIARESSLTELRMEVDLRAGRAEPWIESLRRRTAEDADASADLLWLRGLAEASVNRNAAARNQWRRALRTEPAHLPSRESLARSLQRKNDYAAALQQWERLCRLKPNEVSFHFNRGLCLQRTDNDTEAKRAYQRCLEVQPDHRAARYNLALAHQRADEALEALAELETLLQYHPDHEGALARIDQLRANADEETP